MGLNTLLGTALILAVLKQSTLGPITSDEPALPQIVVKSDNTGTVESASAQKWNRTTRLWMDRRSG